MCVLATNRERHPALCDLGALFEEWLAHEGIAVPERERATWTVVRDWIYRIASGGIEPYEGLALLMQEVVYGDFAPADSHYAGDAYGIEELVGLYWAHEDGYGAKYFAKSRVDRRAVKLASAWLKRHAK